MALAKYAEDNMEIMEERLMLQAAERETPCTFYSSRPAKAIVQPTSKPPHKKKEKKKTKAITCCECNTTFLFTGGEQKFYEQHKLLHPKRCPKCRDQRKAFFKTLKNSKEKTV